MNAGPRILFFGRLRELADGVALDPPPDIRTLAALRTWIAARDPALGAELARNGVRVALNRAIVSDGAFAAGDEIAFMSPLSGG